jgi:hypothetical protein
MKGSSAILMALGCAAVLIGTLYERSAVAVAELTPVTSAAVSGGCLLEVMRECENNFTAQCTTAIFTKGGCALVPALPGVPPVFLCVKQPNHESKQYQTHWTECSDLGFNVGAETCSLVGYQEYCTVKQGCKANCVPFIHPNGAPDMQCEGNLNFEYLDPHEPEAADPIPCST